MPKFTSECVDILTQAISDIDYVEYNAFKAYRDCRKEHGRNYHVTDKRFDDWMRTRDAYNGVLSALEIIQAQEASK